MNNPHSEIIADIAAIREANRRVARRLDLIGIGLAAIVGGLLILLLA